MDPDAAVTPSPGMPYDTFTVSVTYTDADNHDGTICATVCETSGLEKCQASFNLDKGVGENSDGVVYSKTFTTAFGGDDITVSLSATDGHDSALLNRIATFEIDTDRPWLVSDSVSTSTAGAGENVTISVVYCIFDNADDDAVSVNVGGTPYDLVGGDPSGDCINGKIFNITTTIDWALEPQTINFTASNENETSVLQPDGKEYLLSSSTITINDAPTLTAGTAERVGDHFIINVTAEDFRFLMTAVRYNQINSAVICAIGLFVLIDNKTSNKLFKISGLTFFAGTVLFSFSIYLSILLKISSITGLASVPGLSLIHI